jgi:succinyl-diaminopimelate desuccinylase
MGKDVRLLEILEELIAFPTVTGDFKTASACLDYSENILNNSGLRVQRHNTYGFPSLVATTRNTKKPKLFLSAHIDVVPAPAELFNLKSAEGKLLGRGTFDMKFAAACFLAMAEELAAQNNKLDYGIMLTCDEEVGGRNGTHNLLEQGYGSQACLLPDGGDNWRIETAAKGAWWVQAHADGQTAHGSRPWEGDNASSKLIKFLNELSGDAPNDRHTDTTIVVSEIQAGSAMNQVPDAASAMLDIRYSSEAGRDKLSKRLLELADKHHVVLASDPNHAQLFNIDVRQPCFELWENIVQTHRGRRGGDYAISFGASDARYFASKGIPVIVTRPSGGGLHADNEWINRAELIEFYECIKDFTQQFTLKPSEQTLDDQLLNGYNDSQLPETVTSAN